MDSRGKKKNLLFYGFLKDINIFCKFLFFGDV